MARKAKKDPMKRNRANQTRDKIRALMADGTARTYSQIRAQLGLPDSTAVTNAIQMLIAADFIHAASTTLTGPGNNVRTALYCLKPPERCGINPFEWQTYAQYVPDGVTGGSSTRLRHTPAEL